LAGLAGRGRLAGPHRADHRALALLGREVAALIDRAVRVRCAPGLAPVTVVGRRPARLTDRTFGIRLAERDALPGPATGRRAADLVQRAIGVGGAVVERFADPVHAPQVGIAAVCVRGAVRHADPVPRVTHGPEGAD